MIYVNTSTKVCRDTCPKAVGTNVYNVLLPDVFPAKVRSLLGSYEAIFQDNAQVSVLRVYGGEVLLSRRQPSANTGGQGAPEPIQWRKGQATNKQINKVNMLHYTSSLTIFILLQILFLTFCQRSGKELNTVGLHSKFRINLFSKSGPVENLFTSINAGTTENICSTTVICLRNAPD